MTALDGNAIGGLMHEVFGCEMTSAMGTCVYCGNRASMAETVVYLRAPGYIARCRVCNGVLMVVVRRQETKCVDLRGLAFLQAAES